MSKSVGLTAAQPRKSRGLYLDGQGIDNLAELLARQMNDLKVRFRCWMLVQHGCEYLQYYQNIIDFEAFRQNPAA